MNFETPLIHGTLLRRYKRFLADVELENGECVTAHCANPGSMLGLLPENAPVWLSTSDNPKRKLKYSWQLVEIDGSLVGVNPVLANTIAEEALRSGRIDALADAVELKREVGIGDGTRLDFRVADAMGKPAFVEVKSVTLAHDGLARFPDARTARGLKHLGALRELAAAGERAVMLYVIQREDTSRFQAAEDIDPAYAAGLSDAAASGVEILAYDCSVSVAGIALRKRVPVEL